MRVLLAVLIALMPVMPARALSRADGDARSVEIYRAGLESAVEEMEAVAAERSKEMLTAEDKRRVRAAWSSFLDYLLALDSVGAYHREQKSEAGLVISYAAFLAQYRGALDMIDAAQSLPGADAVLNEPVDELGVPAKSYARVKFRWLNVARATEYAALESLYRVRGGEACPRLRALIEEDSHEVLRTGGGRGPKQTARNAMKIAQSAAFTAWFPVQKGVAEWMGDTRVKNGQQFLISPRQIARFAPELAPGDLLLERREWYVSNIGLPGFWPHTAMFIGDAAQRRAFFADDDVRAWVREQGRADGDLDAFLRERFPDAYARAANARVIEAVSEGVSLTTIEHSMAADSFAVLRPRVTRREKAIAIARAFGYVGRPYDFDFDFHTDSALVCSEVLYKAYEGSVTFPLSTTMRRLNTPPNEIVREFDQTFATPRQQFDLVLFLDNAKPADVNAFRASWKRPKWQFARR